MNALRALAPPRLRPRPQAGRPPGPHAAAPLEPQAQIPVPGLTFVSLLNWIPCLSTTLAKSNARR